MSKHSIFEIITSKADYTKYEKSVLKDYFSQSDNLLSKFDGEDNLEIETLDVGQFSFPAYDEIEIGEDDAVSEVTFVIPGTGKHLMIVISGSQSDSSAAGLSLQFNEDSGSFYTYSELFAGSPPVVDASFFLLGDMDSAGGASSFYIYIPNFSRVAPQNVTSFSTLRTTGVQYVGYYSVAIEIESIKISSSFNYEEGTTFSLYVFD